MNTYLRKNSNSCQSDNIS